jgi:Rrf2 family protein
MQLTLSGEYAVRTMIHLASKPFGTIVHIQEVANEWDIPVKYLRKIVAQLSKSGLIISQRGVGGGIKLARSAEKMTLLDVIEGVEGKIFLNKCLIAQHMCSRSIWCSVHTIWSEAQEKMKEVLVSRSLADLASQGVERLAKV